MTDWKAEIGAFAAQSGFFLVGLVLSLLVGMLLAAHLDGASGLLIATIVSGAGLLAAAAGSQTLHDGILDRRDR